ncbi:SLAP domain-containing protein [Companilactobacillus kedongensis]|uniref:SLAP domain-containing protein n=1 Tax=Companilactobacillus kedongensis TaxID=2486004 RepID=UPI000F7A2AFE|nr:SLAP domain-containing protein [Companilactobacillus kedongensis]
MFKGKLLVAIIGTSGAALLGLGLTTNVDASSIATVHDGVIAHLVTRDGSPVSNRALAASTPWQVGETVTINGTTMYQVSTNEFVNSSDVTLSGENSSSDQNTKLVGYAMKNVRLFDDSQNKLSDTRSLAQGSSWQVGRVVKNSKGEVYFQVSTHEWANHNSMVINGNEPSNIEYIANFAINNNNSSNNGTDTNTDNNTGNANNGSTDTDNNGGTGEVTKPTPEIPSTESVKQAIMLILLNIDKKWD